MSSVSFVISVFVKRAINRGHSSYDRLVRSSCILAAPIPKPRRFCILNSLLFFFPESRKRGAASDAHDEKPALNVARAPENKWFWSGLRKPSKRALNGPGNTAHGLSHGILVSKPRVALDSSLFNTNLRTQSGLLFLRKLVRPNNQRF